MEMNLFLKFFNDAASHIDKEKLDSKQLKVVVGVYKSSVFLKLYKLSWANDVPDPVQSPSRIFFSVWTNEEALKEGRLSYNIHALKLRHLKGYRLESRKFATSFRTLFKPFETAWPNVSTAFGPLTLMEGWVSATEKDMAKQTILLCKNFLQIQHLIDDVLEDKKIR